jgi:hypothetical protein
MKKLPPVEGMPAKRPVCQWCGRPLRFWTNDERTPRSGDVNGFASGEKTRRTFAFWRGYPHWETPLFDRLSCALSFATASHLAGYRRKQ